MKKLSRLVLNTALATTLFMGYSLVRAQDQMAPAGDQGGDKMGMQDDHGDWGQKRMDQLKEKLGLTDDQAAKLKESFKKNMEANKPLRDQEKIDMDTLRKEVDTKASDSTVKETLDKLSADRKTLQQSQENFKEKLRSLLSPTQQAQMVLMMEKRMGQGMWGGKPGDRKKHKKDSQTDGGDAKPDAPAPDSAQ